MEELKKAIEQEISGGLRPNLYDVASKWASHSLKSYHGKLLKRALQISVALANFEEQIGIAE